MAVPVAAVLVLRDVLRPEFHSTHADYAIAVAVLPLRCASLSLPLRHYGGNA